MYCCEYYRLSNTNINFMRPTTKSRVDLTLRRVIKTVELEIQNRALGIVEYWEVSEEEKMEFGSNIEAYMKKEIIKELLKTI